ncbi:MAG: rhomboid family intramembrane serine protease, partial [Gammaproteobacteria bacterium]|nr:rhomboid family intramembrane serine protease [Gammaproteobacteria bacterium]
AERGLPHRIVEKSGQQLVLAPDNQSIETLRETYRAFSSGELEITLVKQEQAARPGLLSYFSKYPVTLTLFFLSVGGFFATYFNLQPIVDLLVIQGTDTGALSQRLDLPARISTEEYLAHGQYWRLLTPIFLHFGWVHITFNMLWLWELGRRIEIQGGSLHLLSVVCFIGIASNLYQAESTPLATFGGMSGVIYGLLGYCAVFTLINPQRALQLPMGIYVLMLLSLAIGFSGMLDFVARMANVAHLSGLIFGVVIAVPSALLSRMAPAK